MKLTKIHSDDCEVCVSLGDTAKVLADEKGFEYGKVDLTDLAQNNSPLRDYVINVYVKPNDGMIDLPIYLISTDEGVIQGSGVVKDLEEVTNLITSWSQWANSQKQ